MKRIIVATDGSEGADRAVDVAARVAKATSSDLSILNVGAALSGEEMRQLARAEGGLADALEMLSNQILDARGNRRSGQASQRWRQELHGAMPPSRSSRRQAANRPMRSSSADAAGKDSLV